MTVTASNPNGTAFMTWRDAQISADEEGNAEPPEDEPIAEKFSRTISERIFVKTYLFVDPNRPDDSGDGYTWGSALKNLQTAINRAWDYATVAVTNGIYEPIVTGNKRITIQSVNGATATSINGGGTNRCATLGTLSWHTNTALIGFTLTNGRANNGGGAQYGSLAHCVLVNNTATLYGGGAYYGVLENCVVSGNRANYGGGTHSSQLNNSTVSGNTASHYGGGGHMGTFSNCTVSGNSALFAGGVFNGTLHHCVLRGNTAGHGGGVYYGKLMNCVLTRNTATSYGGGACDALLYNCTVTENTAGVNNGGGGVFDGTLYNCIVWGNLANGVTDNHSLAFFYYSCTTPLPTVPYNRVGNITQDPLFVNAAVGDFRLQVNSPCINAGTNHYVVGMVDLDGKRRILGDRVDMGAYEHEKLRPTLDIPAPLPVDWLDSYLGWQGILGYEDLALSQGANGYLFWESYVAGLVPTDAASKFRITNFGVADDAVSTLKWNPHRDDRVYTVWGKTNLTDTTPWYTPTNSGTRFFKVRVEMP